MSLQVLTGKEVQASIGGSLTRVYDRADSAFDLVSDHADDGLLCWLDAWIEAAVACETGQLSLSAANGNQGFIRFHKIAMRHPAKALRELRIRLAMRQRERELEIEDLQRSRGLAPKLPHLRSV